MIATADRFVIRWVPSAVLTIWAACGVLGCSQAHDRITETVSPFPTGTIIAVAPAMNFSGSSAFDPVKVADLMVSELTTVRGLRVIGVNRVLAILGEQGFGQIQSPTHAIQVCDRLGADFILVFAVTEYDPYRPVVGVAAQLYGRHPGKSEPISEQSGTASDDSRPFPANDKPDSPKPWAETQRVYNGVHERVQRLVKEYAENREGDKSPYGWRKYLASQEWYLRFCCFRTASDLMGLSPAPAVAHADRHEEYGS